MKQLKKMVKIKDMQILPFHCELSSYDTLSWKSVQLRWSCGFFLRVIFLKVVPSSLQGVVSNPLVQQPAMTGGIDTGSPITFPEEQEDPRVSGDTNTGGGIWGFFKVAPL